MDELVEALLGVRFWVGREVRFGLDGVGQVVLRQPDGHVLAVFAGPVRSPPASLLVPWARPGGLVGMIHDPELAAAASLPLFEDTRERRREGALDAAWALYRFAVCFDPAHGGQLGSRVLCPGCRVAVEDACAQAEEESLAADAVRRLRAMAAQDARER